MNIEEILEHESQSVGRPAVYYNSRTIPYIDRHGHRQELWLVIYETETPQVQVDLGHPTFMKRWVVHDTGESSSYNWTGGIIG